MHDMVAKFRSASRVYTEAPNGAGYRVGAVEEGGAAPVIRLEVTAGISDEWHPAELTIQQARALSSALDEAADDWESLTKAYRIYRDEERKRTLRERGDDF